MCACEHTHVNSVPRGSHSGRSANLQCQHKSLNFVSPSCPSAFTLHQPMFSFFPPSACYVPGTVLGTEDILVNRQDTEF